MPLILKFSDISMQDLPQVGGKNASLGEMINKLSNLNVKVPNGFATTAEAYQQFIKENNLENKIYQCINNLDINNLENLHAASSNIRESIINAKFTKIFEEEISNSYKELKLNEHNTVAVRSSATAEDLADASFAGQQETFLNVSGIDDVLLAIKKVYASLFTERAIVYRINNKINPKNLAISVGVQKMIRSDLAASGVMFTIDTESGFDKVIFITATYGLGETLVQGAVNPDEFYVYKPNIQSKYDPILNRKLGSKLSKMVYDDADLKKLKTVDINPSDRIKFCINDDEIIQLSNCASIIEKHYGKPMDIEWAKDGLDQEIYIVQARPETIRSREKQQILEQYILNEIAKPITSGRSVGQKIGQGSARTITTPQQMKDFLTGEILVADITDPDWEPIMKRASAIITNRGGRTCHAAIVAREMGIPTVVGCGNATEIISDGTPITVSCSEGETGFVYPGLLKYQVNSIEIGKLPEIPVNLCMNLANPEQAFEHQFLPNQGVGLVRLEFIISNMIGVHPNAILRLDLVDSKVREDILQKTAAYSSPVEFYIEKLAEGIATIAAAFYPKPIIVRFSDFKSNEYINLLGGSVFEPHEENPMIGYRGGSRYISELFRPCFDLECEAIKRVRNKKGLINTCIMFPFVRTVAEAQQLIEITKKNGLQRGKDDLKIYMMCEIPSNALLAEDFLQYFDGYSIGSNDLTQLTLGLDRDSALVANLFDERNAAVKKSLQEIIKTCKKLGKYVGICGQGPSDHLDLAEWLMQEGIDSISLSPDSILKTWIKLGDLKSNK